MRPGKAGWLILALILAPFPVIGDAECDEALSAMRNQPGAIHQRVESEDRPAGLDANPHKGAWAAVEALGLQQRERLRE